MKRGLLLLLLLVTATGCGPGFRFRSPDILAKGDGEFGVGIGAAGNLTVKTIESVELQGFVRGSPSEHVEVGGRFYTQSFNHFGGAFELRIAPIKRPVALSIDLGLMAGPCCRLESNLTVGGGFDVGISFGGRIGGDFGPAPYIAPHFQMFGIPAGLDPIQDRGNKLLFVPMGVDLPLGKSPIHLRPELLVTFKFYDALPTEAILGGGFAIAIQGPGLEKLRQQQKAKRDKKEADEAPVTPTPASSPTEERAAPPHS